MNERREYDAHEDGFILLGGYSGSLSILAVADSTSYNDAVRQASTEWLGVCDAHDWEALFHDALGVFRFAAEGQVPTRGGRERIAELQRHFEESFARTPTEYPMLRRFKDAYEDVTFGREEIGRLRDECRRVEATARGAKAAGTLRVLIHACDKALELKMGLLFACD